MINWIIAGLAIWILFLIYLTMTDQHVHFHYQNTSYETKPEPTWRNGRAWFSLSYNDEGRSHKYYSSPTFHPWWYLFHRSPIGIKVYLAGDDFDIQVYIGFLFGRVGLQLAGTRFFRWLFKNVYRMGWGYSTGIEMDFTDDRAGLTLYFAYNDMASGPSLRIKVPKWKWLYNYERRKIIRRRWKRDAKLLNLRVLRGRDYLEIDPLPMGVHFWWAVDYIKDKMPTGGGWRLSIDFDQILLGSYEREEENIGEPIKREIPIEPDNRLGLHYFATFQRQRETRWRGHFPGRKRIADYWEISTDNPPMHAGKGENSWDLDDDGIMGCSAFVETIDEAIADYVQRCQADRKRYGLPGVIYEAQRGRTE